MERKLATIQIIEKIEPIENADLIVKANILGWECVVKKDEFKVGDKVIYCEIDSVLPEKPEFEFLRNRKFRIRTIKLKNQISQGICFSLFILPKGNYKKDDDVTELIGITKYLTPSEVEENNQEEIKIKKNKIKKFLMRYSLFRKILISKKQPKGFPQHVAKTDEERVQNFPHVLEQFKDEIVYITEKVDYQSVTFTGKMIPKFDNIFGKLFKQKFKFIVCSRNFVTNNKNDLYWAIAKKYNIEKILKENSNLTIQGEQGDTKIQGNKYKIKEPKLWIFNIYDHKKKYLYDFDEMKEFCLKNNLETVPFLKYFKLSDIGNNVTEFVNFSKGKSIINKEIEREGVVIRCVKNGQKVLSFKVINPNFLLKYEN
jgi:hypothetical protein